MSTRTRLAPAIEWAGHLRPLLACALVAVLMLLSLTLASAARADSAIAIGSTSATAPGDLQHKTNCGVSANGAVWCWGDATNGTLGTATSSASLGPVQIAGISGAKSVSVGYEFACAVLADGTVKCWGDDSQGQLGDGSIGGTSATPQTVAGVTGATTVTAGTDFACALTGGAAKCWGDNTSYQLGNGGSTSTATPTTVSGGGSGVTAIAAGNTYACAVFSGGAPKCWGYAQYGALGNGQMNADASTPQPVQGLTSGVTAISAGFQQTCAVTSSGIECWGWDPHGDLGTGPPASESGINSVTSPEPVIAPSGSSSPLGSDGHVTTISVTTLTICAADAGAAYCWGSNAADGLGDGGSVSESGTPLPVGNLGGIMLVAGNCAATAHGVLECWGRYPGDGSTTEASAPVAVPHYPGGDTLTIAEPGGGSGTVTSTPAALSCSTGSGVCSALFDDDKTVTLTALPAAGSNFAGFSGGCQATGTTCTITLTADTSVTATFDANPTVAIGEPSDGAVYLLGSVPAASYSCTAGPDETLASCVATVDGTQVADGATLPSTSGSHTMVLTATDTDGGTASQSASYTVGNPGPSCGGTQPVRFGIIEAVGCLTQANSLAQIPSADIAALCTHLNLSSSACYGKLNGELESGNPLRFSDKTVRINGLDFFPRGGSDILLDPADNLVVSGDTSVEIMSDQVSLYTGELVIDGSQPGRVHDLEANLDKLITSSTLARRALNLGGFGLGGTLTVELDPYTTKLTGLVQLPNEFESDTSTRLTLTATAIANNQDDRQFNDILVNGPTLNFKAFKLSNDAFCYQAHISDDFCQAQTGVTFGAAPGSQPSWNVTAKVSVLGVTINAAPPPPTYGIGFVNGQFAFAGAEASFPDPGIPIGNGVSLTRLGGSLALNPTRISGTIGLNLGPTVGIDGAVFVVLPTYGQRYTFTGTELGNVLQAPLVLPKITVDQFAIAAGGDLSLKLGPAKSAIPVKLASGYLVYAYPSYVAVGGEFGINFGDAFHLTGSIQGAANFAASQYDLEGQLLFYLNHTVILPELKLEVDGVVSNAGIGACGLAKIGKHYVQAGIGKKWTGPVNVMLGSCTLSPYQVAVAASLARAANATLKHVTVPVPAGVPSEMIKITGQGGAPDITITGPHGQRARSGAGFSDPWPFVINRVPSTHTTWVAIIHPRGGRYRISAVGTSPPILSVRYAHGISTSVHAAVQRRHGKLTLRWRDNLPAGARLTFLQRGRGVDKLIASVSASRGTVALQPSPGPAGVRQIVALASLNGTPLVLRPGHKMAGQVVVATFKASGPRRLAKVRKLAAYEQRGTLTVTFDGLGGVKTYAVVVALNNGMRTQYEVKRPRLTMTVQTAGATGGSVTVVGLGDQLHTLDGATATVKIGSHLPRK